MRIYQPLSGLKVAAAKYRWCELEDFSPSRSRGKMLFPAGKSMSVTWREAAAREYRDEQT